MSGKSQIFNRKMPSIYSTIHMKLPSPAGKEIPS
jgi:hypothetical protein